MAEQQPAVADFGEPPDQGEAPLATMALILALGSLFCPGGLVAIPALFMAASARRKRGPSTTLTAARVISVVSLAGWAVILSVLAATRLG